MMLKNRYMSPVVAHHHNSGHRDVPVGFYRVTFRMVMTVSTALTLPTLVYHDFGMGLFSPGFVVSATLLAGFVLARYAANAAESISVVVELTNQ